MSAWSIEIKPHGEDFRVHLIVGSQSFIVSSNPAHDMEGAEWMAAQVRHAILAIERGVLEEVLEACEGLPDGADCTFVLDQMSTSRLPSCSGCEPGSEGTHSEGTKEHP